MRDKPVRENSISGIFVLLSFALFAASILLVLMYGIKIYRECVTRDNEAFTTRTVSQYLVTKIRYADENGAVSVGSFSDEYKDLQTLFIKEKFDNESYITRVYCLDGFIMELFSEESENVNPYDGNEVTLCKALSLSSENDLIRATITDETDTVTDEYIMIRSKRR